MSKMAQIAADIEQYLMDGYPEQDVSIILKVPIEWVNAIAEQVNGPAMQEARKQFLENAEKAMEEIPIAYGSIGDREDVE